MRTEPVRLLRHPASGDDGVQVIEVVASLEADGDLGLWYQLTGDCTRLRIPPPRPAARADGLWRHSCFELFARAAGEAVYVEFNFSPSGEWAAYAFRAYREPVATPEIRKAPPIRLHQTPGGLLLETRVALAGLLPVQGKLQLGLSAVIEGGDGTLSYWALRHPTARPDFHHPEGFALSLDSRNTGKT